ncbi:MAG: hypothetical protein QXR57_04995 [Metallosphaera sp.]|uniref:hypothetical protein n=1 Tax=Metallosphaera sp. TaxID=2020860 RepID=UPI00315E460D
MKCVNCGGQGEILVSGKILCSRCSRQEIFHRVRRNLSRSGVNLKESKSLLIYPSFYREIAELLNVLLAKTCVNCNLTIRYLETDSKSSINLTLRELLLQANKEPEKIVFLPFTADFFSSYLVYSSTSIVGSYLSLYGLTFNISEKTFISPLYDTPLSEMKGFSELTGELKTSDETFNTILNWFRSNFSDNEVFHTFPPSVQVIINKFNKCRRCGALIETNEYCKACSTELSLETKE